MSQIASRENKAKPTPASHTTHLEDAIENEAQKRLQNKRSERSIRREEMVQKLMKNAFWFSDPSVYTHKWLT